MRRPGDPKTRRRCKGEVDDLVLHLIAKANHPVSAYDIAAHAASTGVSLVPNQVYRTTSRLIAANRVIRIEALQAFAIRRPGANACLVCMECRSVVTIPARPAEIELAREAAATGFALQGGTVEARGLCPDCRPLQGPDA